LVTCPNCGQPVRESQRYCGACGTDVHVSFAVATPASAPGDDQASPYAYAQPSGYGYETQPAEPPAAGRMAIVVGILILSVCCAFACGLVFGFEIIPTMFGLGTVPAGKPTPTPTPSSLNLLPTLVRFIV
jgi:hypothetical protein